MRQLYWLADTHERIAWNHTSQLLAMIGNCNRDKDKHPQPYKPTEFHPFYCKQARPAVPVTPELLRERKRQHDQRKERGT